MYAFDASGWLAGESVNLPALGQKLLCEIVSDDAGDSGDECDGDMGFLFGKLFLV